MTANRKYDYTAVKRTAEHRKRMAGAGYKLVQVWAHTDDTTDVKDYVSQLRKSGIKQANNKGP